MPRFSLLGENYVDSLISGLVDDVKEIKSSQTVGRQSVNIIPYIASSVISITSSLLYQTYILQFVPDDKSSGNAWPYMILPIGNAISTTGTYNQDDLDIFLDYSPGLSSQSQRYTLTIENNTQNGFFTPQIFNLSVQFIVFGPAGSLSLVS